MLWSETPTLVHGMPGRSRIDPAAGYAHIDATHRRKCPRAGGVAFVRMGAFGVANDLNRAAPANCTQQHRLRSEVPVEVT